MSLLEFAEQELEETLESQGDFERPGIKEDGATAVVVSRPTRDAPLENIEFTLKERGLNPADWITERVVVNTWETTAFNHGQPINVTNHQLKIWLRSKLELHLPAAARTDGPIWTKPPNKLMPYERPMLAAFISDQQAPYHDDRLHDLTCQWLNLNQPDILICGGDGTDFPTLTRHTKRPERDFSASECIDAAYSMVRDYVEASPASSRYYIEGNHEYHLKREMVERLPAAWDIRVGGTDIQALSIPHLLRLDELGFEYIGNWPHGTLTFPNWPIMFRHGWLASGRSGDTALKTVEKLGCSVCVGHTHRRGVTYLSIPYAQANELIAVEAGTMAVVEGGLGYEPSPNWQNGFATFWLFPDGSISADNAKYLNGSLVWQDQHYS